MSNACQRLLAHVTSAPERAREDQEHRRVGALESEALPEELRIHARSCLSCQVELMASERLTDLLADVGAGFRLSPDAARRAMAAHTARAAGAARIRAWRPALSTAILVVAVGGIAWFGGRLWPLGEPEDPALEVPRVEVAAPGTQAAAAQAGASAVAAAGGGDTAERAAQGAALEPTKPAQTVGSKGAVSSGAASSGAASSGAASSGAASSGAASSGAALSGAASRGAARASVAEGALHVTGCPEDARQGCLPGAWLEAGPAEVVRVTLSDGTRLALNHGTRVHLAKGQARALVLERGEVLLDVVHQAPLPPLRVETAQGTARVVGTRLMVSAGAAGSLVMVLRGKVVAVTDAGTTPVRAGEQARLQHGRRPMAEPAESPAEATRWAEMALEPAEGTMGVGTLTARRPGAKKDAGKALRLTEHRVSVRISGPVARTVVEEVFANEGAARLEGTYAFPIPPGAQIAGLDLLVDGVWREGAMVARDRGRKIWAGVIRKATPKRLRRDAVEYIWIPGPWRDPAILNWKEGARFELKIFPIKAHSERRVRIAWTEPLKRVAGARRYVYPLATMGNAVPVADRFVFEARIGGATDPEAVRRGPYEMSAAVSGAGTTLRMARRGFVPKGDLVLDVPDPRAGAELVSWTYRAAGTGSGYGVVALRPRLPERSGPGATGMDVLFVVDRSYSTQKERLRRAARLVARVVGGLDRESRVAVLACADACRLVGAGFEAASSPLAASLKTSIEGLEPLGATRLEHAFDRAAALLKAASAQNARVIYVGDGMPAVGELSPGRVAAWAKRRLDGVRLTTVSLGGAVDEPMLRALADVGGGAYVAHGAHATVRQTAWRVLARQRGEPLRGAELSFPQGVSAVAPAAFVDLWPGEERRVAFRLTGARGPGVGGAGGRLRGDIVLRGTLAGEPFERRWAVDWAPREVAGNAFVPRAWAELRIADLQGRKVVGPDQTAEIVRVSKAHHVLSRYTSLLVLESEAMERAFSVRATRPAVEWTGDEAAEAQVALTDGSLVGRALAEEDNGQGDADAGGGNESGGNESGGNESGLLGGARGASSRLSGGMGGGAHGAGGLGNTGGRAKRKPRGPQAEPLAQEPPRGAADTARLGSGRMARRELTRKVEARVRLRPAHVRGSAGAGLGSGAIARVMRRHVGAFRRVFQRSLRRDPSLAGKATIEFAILASGRVGEVTVRGAVPGAMRQGLAAVMRRMRFPATAHGEVVRVSYPMVFQGSAGGVGAGERRRGHWAARKKVWFSEATLRAPHGTTAAERRELARRETRLAENPESRDRTRDLVRWHVRMGDLEAAARLAGQWLEKDRMDIGALVTLSDLAALRGDPARSRALLASAVDVDPRRVAGHRRLIGAYEAAGESGLRCAHVLTWAQVAPLDWRAQVAAVRCGESRARFVEALPAKKRRKAARALRRAAKPARVRGAINLSASWDGGADLDIVVVTPKGRRVSWQGGARKTRAADAKARDRERLALSAGEVGRYQVFVIERGTGEERGSLAGGTGTLVVSAFGQRRRFRFDVAAGRAAVADVQVARRWRWEWVR